MKDLKDKRHEIIFQARMNIHYHTSSENVFLKINNFSNFFSVILGSATVASLSQLMPESALDHRTLIGVSCAFIVTILNGFVLSFNVSGKISEHRDLRRRWHEIFLEINSVWIKENLTENELFDLKHKIDCIEREIAKINGDEPPPNKKRLHKAFNAASISLGFEAK